MKIHKGPRRSRARMTRDKIVVLDRCFDDFQTVSIDKRSSEDVPNFLREEQKTQGEAEDFNRMLILR